MTLVTVFIHPSLIVSSGLGHNKTTSTRLSCTWVHLLSPLYHWSSREKWHKYKWSLTPIWSLPSGTKRLLCVFWERTHPAGCSLCERCPLPRLPPRLYSHRTADDETGCSNGSSYTNTPDSAVTLQLAHQSLQESISGSQSISQDTNQWVRVFAFKHTQSLQVSGLIQSVSLCVFLVHIPLKAHASMWRHAPQLLLHRHC